MKAPQWERFEDLPPPPNVREPEERSVAIPDGAESLGEDRRTRGARLLYDMLGESGEMTLRGLRELAPDLADWMVEFSYGEVMARPGLDRRSRQLAAIAALTALGNAQPQLRMHIQGALKVGCRTEEIVEVMLQMAVFAGFPAAINALSVARDVLPQESHGRRTD
jgi:4-carboxymuconolactone decarboxylase